MVHLALVSAHHCAPISVPIHSFRSAVPVGSTGKTAEREFRAQSSEHRAQAQPLEATMGENHEREDSSQWRDPNIPSCIVQRRSFI
jgi:hypothetical protein